MLSAGGLGQTVTVTMDFIDKDGNVLNRITVQGQTPPTTPEIRRDCCLCGGTGGVGGKCHYEGLSGVKKRFLAGDKGGLKPCQY